MVRFSRFITHNKGRHIRLSDFLDIEHIIKDICTFYRTMSDLLSLSEKLNYHLRSDFYSIEFYKMFLALHMLIYLYTK